MLPIIPNRKFFYIFSGALILISVIALSMWGLKLGIDFKGGSEFQLQFEKPVDKNALAVELKKNNFEATIKDYAQNSYLISTKTLSNQDHQQILSVIDEKFQSSNPKELSFEIIGPSIGNELRKKAIISIILVLVGISIYIAWAFRKVSKPVASWKYGFSTLAALFHDLIIPVGVFAVGGKFLNWQIDSNFIVALLVIMGFSVHDTIVVFDRIRENVKMKSGQFSDIVNISVNQTIARSINTSLTVLIVLSSLFFLGDPSIKLFILTLLIGISIGTYSSILIASPILVDWQPRKIRK